MNAPLEPIIISACGGKLTEPENYLSANYNGKRVYFCTRACYEPLKKTLMDL